jgi:hypothetical protein
MIRILSYDGGDVRPVDPERWTLEGPPGTRTWIDVNDPGTTERMWLDEDVGLSRRHLSEFGRFPPAPGAVPSPQYIYGMLPTPGDGLHFFLGRTWLVTLHTVSLPALDALWDQYAKSPDRWRFGLDQLLGDFVDELVVSSGAQLRALRQSPSADKGEGLVMLSAGQLVTISDLVNAEHEALDANVQDALQLSKRRIQTIFTQSQILVENAGREVSSRRERFWRTMLVILLFLVLATITLLAVLLQQMG